MEPTKEFFLCLLIDLKVLLRMLGLEFVADLIVTKESDPEDLFFYGVAYLFDLVDFSDFIILSTITMEMSLFYYKSPELAHFLGEIYSISLYYF